MNDPDSESLGRCGEAGRRREWAALLALMVGYAIVFAAYYPVLSGVEDEVGFVNQALVWSRGAISAEGAGYEPSRLGNFAEVAGRHVAQRHPGRSLVALPFVAVGGLDAVFWSGLALHLATALLAAAVLTRLGRSPLWAVLVLFHPTLAIYSRTVMADAASGAGLLLAGLALTGAGAASAFAAGLAVGVAAFMRYQAALATPFVALAALVPPVRDRPGRDAAICLLGAAVAGSLIMAYNLVVYRSPVESYTASRGYFAREFFVPHLTFYATALMVIWPGMLVAPLLDRSRLRWLVRGACGLFLVSLCFYYFHDAGSSRVETLILGQRLLQIALPLWIVSYAGVVDDWVARPLRRRLAPGAWRALVALGCVALLGLTGAMFHKHQGHLRNLQTLRDAVARTIPSGALVIVHGPIGKLFAIPRDDVPSYRFRRLEYGGKRLDYHDELVEEDGPWYLAVMPKFARDPMPEAARELIATYDLVPVSTDYPRLQVYVGQPPDPRPTPDPDHDDDAEVEHGDADAPGPDL